MSESKGRKKNMKLKLLQKCIVDADGVFNLLGVKFKINGIKEYKVYNSYKDNPEDYTNLAEMCEVKVYIDLVDNRLHFFNENDEEMCDWLRGVE